MCTHKPLWVWCYGAMSTHECWWALRASWRHAHDCSWALTSAQCSMAPTLWLLMSAANKQLWALISTQYPSWAFIISQEQPLSTHVHSWAWCHGALTTCENSRAVMSMAPWGSECSSALMSAHNTIAPYSQVLVGAHEHTWYEKQKKRNFLNFEIF